MEVSRERIVAILVALAVLILLARSCGRDEQPPPVPEPVATPPADVPALADDDSAAETQATPALPSARVLAEGETLPGQAADGRGGDVLLTSSRGVRFVVTAIGHRVGVQVTGGNLVDVVVPGSEDAFDGMCAWLDRTFPRQPAYREMQIDGASVTVTGVDSDAPTIAVQTTWRLLPEDDERLLARLEVTSTLTNLGPSPILDYDLGDIVGWGGLRHFAPGPGWDLAGKDVAIPWVGGEAGGTAILLVAQAPMTGPHGSSWTDPVYSAGALLPSVPVSWRRQVLVGRSLADLVPAALVQLGVPSVPVVVEARHEEDEPVAGAEVELISLGEPAGPSIVGRTDESGELRTALPPGRYRVLGRSPDRGMVSAGEGDVGPGVGGTLRVMLTGPGRMRLHGTDDAGRDVPIRFTITGRDGTPDPDFGSEALAIGRNRAHLVGSAELPLPPGSYRVVASRGPAWSLETRDVEVPELLPLAPPPQVEVRLRQVVPGEGWRQCDLHQHSALSYDSAVPPVQGVIASAAEGLDCIATTDHDAVADWTAWMAESGQQDSILWLPGIEVSSEQKAGHYNAYRWEPALGIVEHRDKSAAEVVAAIRAAAPAAVLQLNHPRAGRIGMFDLVGIDQQTGLLIDQDPQGAPTGATYDFDAIEVINGKSVEDAEVVLASWLRMVDAGKVATIVGSSDSHRLVGQERGIGRTWVQVGGATGPDGVIRAIRETRRATATTGPFLDIERVADGTPHEAAVRVTMRAPEWMPVDEVQILGGEPVGNGAWSLGRWRPGTPGMQETVQDGLRTWVLDLRVPLGGVEGWVIAVARGSQPMLPWADCKAFAVTNPLRLEQ